ncbi:MAG: tRNA 2-thiouridine(34) synthase MnmA [Thermoleophilia bacterium]
MDDPFLNHFRHSRHAGVLADAHGAGAAGDPACGALISIGIRFTGPVIAAAGFQATGSSAAIAAGSLLTEMITGVDWRLAATVSPAQLETVLNPDDEPGRTRSLAVAAAFAVEALHAALEDSISRDNFPIAGRSDDRTVLVAMSGGVDSSVACLLQQQSGQNVIGVTMRLWTDPDCDETPGASCCSPQAILDARAVCHSLGLPHLTVDYAAAFERLVVDEFVDEYLAGRTPNPCAGCNGGFRFPELMTLADRLGADRVSTGHYSRVVPVDDGFGLARGADAAKDQSYMLWGISSALLPRLDFPLGELTKSAVRRLAREALLPTHARPESQEVCFIPDDDYRRFLRSRSPRPFPPGEIVDLEGDSRGRHTGYADYTIGQRHGLRVSAPEPLYVVATDPERNLVVVGGREDLAVRLLRLERMNEFADASAVDDLTVQVRYNSPPMAARVTVREPFSWTVELEEPVYGIAPGQSAVLFAGDVVVAGGVIAATSP